MLSDFLRLAAGKAPIYNYYNGPILDANGEQVTTAGEYDDAMLATRSFWFQLPSLLIG